MYPTSRVTNPACNQHFSAGARRPLPSCRSRRGPTCTATRTTGGVRPRRGCPSTTSWCVLCTSDALLGVTQPYYTQGLGCVRITRALCLCMPVYIYAHSCLLLIHSLTRSLRSLTSQLAPRTTAPSPPRPEWCPRWPSQS